MKSSIYYILFSLLAFSCSKNEEAKPDTQLCESGKTLFELVDGKEYTSPTVDDATMKIDGYEVTVVEQEKSFSIKAEFIDCFTSPVSTVTSAIEWVDGDRRAELTHFGEQNILNMKCFEGDKLVVGFIHQL